jgi:chromosome segregation ATPase
MLMADSERLLFSCVAKVEDLYRDREKLQSDNERLRARAEELQARVDRIGSTAMNKSAEIEIPEIMMSFADSIADKTLEIAAVHFGNRGDLKNHQEIARELRALKRVKL